MSNMAKPGLALSELMCVEDFELLARQNIAEGPWTYFTVAADAGATLKDNEQAYSR